MRRFGVPYSVFLVMIMNTIYAFAREPVSYHTVRIDNLDIFYREAGPKNAPVLLLLHGVPTSSRMYQPMLESPLSARYRLIAPDFPGFGHSSWPGPKAFRYGRSADLTRSVASELSTFVRQHDLQLLIDEGHAAKGAVKVLIGSSSEGTLPLPIERSHSMGLAMPNSFRAFGINE